MSSSQHLNKEDAAASSPTSLTAMTMTASQRGSDQRVIACEQEEVILIHSATTMANAVAAVSGNVRTHGKMRRGERRKQPNDIKSSTTSAASSVLSYEKDTSLGGILSDALEISVQSVGEVRSQEKKLKVESATICISCEVLTLDFANALKLDVLTRGNVNSFQLTNMTITRDDSTLIQRTFASLIHENRFILEYLCLSKCQLGDAFAVQLANLISSEPIALRSLDLSRNEITDRGAEALTDAMKPRHCTLRELDISNNRLTTAGILVFANALPEFHHLRVLRLADSEHLLPVSIFQQFCAAAEKNYVMHTLTLGSEIMDGSASFEHGAAPGKDVDALLRYWWQEPVYTAATDRIRFLLHLNHAGLTDIFQSGCSSVQSLRSILDNVQPEKQLEACFRILQRKPDVLVSLYTAEAGMLLENDIITSATSSDDIGKDD